MKFFGRKLFQNLFSNRSPAARRRRRGKAENDVAVRQTWLPQNIANLTQKRQDVSGIYQPRTLRKDHLVDNIPYAKDLTALHISLSDSATTMTDLEESKISSTISVKRIRRASIVKMNNKEKPDKTENVDIKSENHRDNNGNSAVTQRSAVTIVRVKKVPNMEETYKSTSNTSRQEMLSATSTIPKKTAQVNITKISRSNTPKTQRPRAASVGNVDIVQLNKSSVEMQPIRNHSKTSTLATNGKANTGNGVVVTKIPKKLTALHSYQS